MRIPPRRIDNDAIQEKLAILRPEIQIGLDDAAAGHFSIKSISDPVKEVLDEAVSGPTRGDRS